MDTRALTKPVEDVDDAVKAARATSEHTWSKKSTLALRARFINRWTDLIEENIKRLHMLEWLAAGNTIVMNPVEQTPLSALLVAELSAKAGFPPGVVNIVNGLGAVTRQAISSHTDIDKLTFTGSTITGCRIMESAATSNLKRVSLELAGKSPVVVFDNVDIEDTANWVATAILFNHGQDCCAASHLFVQDTIKYNLLAKLKENFESYAIGDSFDIKPYWGPQVSKLQQKRVLFYIQSGIEVLRC